MGPSQLSEKQNETRRERRRKHNRRRHEKDRLTVRLKSKKYQNLSKLIFPREKSSFAHFIHIESFKNACFLTLRHAYF